MILFSSKTKTKYDRKFQKSFPTKFTYATSWNGKDHDNIFVLQHRIKTRTEDPNKHLQWSSLQKQLTPKRH